MDKILILDDSTINQIAAGEVVERPASIIKELVENSIDANATSITVEIRHGGIAYIRVTDNGGGMGAEDAKRAFERHATSKISTSMDLANISTLGFRGEALASIASVTQIEMTSRMGDSDSGIKIINHGGNFVKIEETGCPEGTTMIVKNLFYNTPARFKFLKSPRTETAAISDLMAKLILACPDVAFKYINNGKIIYYSSGDGNLKHAIFSVYGKDVVEQLFPIKAIDIAPNIKISGYLGKPSLARKNRTHQSFFVNGRYVKSELICRGIEAAYKPYLTINMFPWVVLHLDIDPRMADVNVHPAKTEIRFNQAEEIEDAIKRQVENNLWNSPYIPLLKEKSFIPPIANDGNKMSDQQLDTFSSVTYYADDPRDNEGIGIEQNKDLTIHENLNIPFRQNNYEEAVKTQNDRDGDPYPGGDSKYINEAMDFSIPLKVVGKIFSTYIIVEWGRQCFLIDQHAAHERILFEKYKKMLSQQAIKTQYLLPPLIIEVTHGEKIMIKDSIETFHSLGFEIEGFGGNAFAIRGVPVILGSSNPKEFFQELLYNSEELKQGSNYQFKIDDIIKMSCKKAVKAGDAISDLEITTLLKELLQQKAPMTCPHGRPIMITLTQNVVEKMFKRIQ